MNDEYLLNVNCIFMVNTWSCFGCASSHDRNRVQHWIRETKTETVYAHAIVIFFRLWRHNKTSVIINYWTLNWTGCACVYPWSHKLSANAWANLCFNEEKIEYRIINFNIDNSFQIAIRKSEERKRENDE